MKNIKRSVFSVALCAMLVFCIGFYSSVEPTTAWFTDTSDKTGTFNMDELSIELEGDSTEIELNFKAATKSSDPQNDNKPEPMFEYAAEFYIFKVTNNSSNVTAKLIVDVASESTNVDFCVYELGEPVPENTEIIPFLVESETTTAADAQTPEAQAEETSTKTDAYVNWSDVYTDPDGKRVLKHGNAFYYASLEANLNTDTDMILEPGASGEYCIGIWYEYDDNNKLDATEGVDTVTCDATVNISAVQYVDTSATE